MLYYTRKAPLLVWAMSHRTRGYNEPPQLHKAQTSPHSIHKHGRILKKSPQCHGGGFSYLVTQYPYIFEVPRVNKGSAESGGKASRFNSCHTKIHAAVRLTARLVSPPLRSLSIGPTVKTAHYSYMPAGEF
jgi:hypothetical protein